MLAGSGLMADVRSVVWGTLQRPMPALVCLVRCGLDAEPITVGGYLRPRHVQVDGQHAARADQQIVGEHRVDGADTRSGTADESQPRPNLVVHER